MSEIKNSKKEIEEVYDFTKKLLQPSLLGRLRSYVRWQAEVRRNHDQSDSLPNDAPVSINLDLTTGCNYACDHCVDWDILNQPFKFNHPNLLNSLDRMWQNGLKSVILIGGGEPTLYSKFENIVEFLKEREVHVAIVSNGSGMQKIERVAYLFTDKDWVRLSLDSATDATFQAMHKPKKPITLEKICRDVFEVKYKHPNLIVGFSYIVAWENAYADGRKIVSNIDEIVPAAKLARDHGFNYLSIKPFLERSKENSAEIIEINQPLQEYQATIARIIESIKEAKKYETSNFKIRESTNLKALEKGTTGDYTKQPRNCHMTYFRQVLSPLGTFICPVYRYVDKATIGDKNAYSTEENYENAKQNTSKLIKEFNAAYECRNVTCLYNSVNWFIEDLIQNPEKLDSLQPVKENKDYFL